MTHNIHRFITLLIASLMVFSPLCETFDVIAAGLPQQSATKGRRKAGKGKKGNTKSDVKRRKETSSDVKRRAAATQKEIKLTEEQIKENDRSVRKGLNELGKLETEIATSKVRIKETSGRINYLTGKIDSLESDIASNEKELLKLRTEYLKAVKKMRVARKNNSDLAFIFASENFSQALRRMRYLRQFSSWKDRQSAAIGGKTKELKTQKELLAQTRTQQSEALRRQKSDEQTLRQQHTRQDAIVAELRKNGAALKTHLGKKQAEANQLRNRIAALIVEEERRAAEERARKEAERKAEEERLAREQAERERIQREESERQARLLAESKEAGEKPGKKAEKSKDVAKAEKEAEKRAEKARKKEEKKSKDSGKKSDSKVTDKNYADARKRRPRSQRSGQTSGSGSLASANLKTSTSAGNFAAMKGSLPKPASGSFKVVSRFGRQSLPNLPDVVYDNPGIDAEVSSGSSALAVYNGKVSGVYMLPGYHTVVIVNHGNYYTVYGNIVSPAVKVGDQVRAGQGLGQLAPDEEDSSRSSIHFEVWRNREKLNPLEWIR